MSAPAEYITEEAAMILSPFFFFSFRTLFGEGKMSWMPRWWEPSQQLSYSFFIQVINISSFSSGVDVVCENWHGTDVVVLFSIFFFFLGFEGMGIRYVTSTSSFEGEM